MRKIRITRVGTGGPEKRSKILQALGLKHHRRRSQGPNVSGKTPEQLAAMVDYHRARRGVASDRELAELLGVHRSRLAAWKRGDEVPNSENGHLLSHLAVVVGELQEFLDPDVIPDWLTTGQFTLGGRTPVDALRDGRLAEVLYAANATEHGAYI